MRMFNIKTSRQQLRNTYLCNMICTFITETFQLQKLLKIGIYSKVEYIPRLRSRSKLSLIRPSQTSVTSDQTVPDRSDL